MIFCLMKLLFMLILTMIHKEAIKNPPRGPNNDDANEGKDPKNNGGNDK